MTDPLNELRKLVEYHDQYEWTDACLGTAASEANLPTLLAAWEKDREELERLRLLVANQVRKVLNTSTLTKGDQ